MLRQREICATPGFIARAARMSHDVCVEHGRLRLRCAWAAQRVGSSRCMSKDFTLARLAKAWPRLMSYVEL